MLHSLTPWPFIEIFLLVLLQELAQEQGISFRKLSFPVMPRLLCIRTEDPFSGALLGMDPVGQCRLLERSRGPGERPLSTEGSKAECLPGYGEPEFGSSFVQQGAPQGSTSPQGARQWKGQKREEAVQERQGPIPPLTVISIVLRHDSHALLPHCAHIRAVALTGPDEGRQEQSLCHGAPQHSQHHPGRSRV